MLVTFSPKRCKPCDTWIFFVEGLTKTHSYSFSHSIFLYRSPCNVQHYYLPKIILIYLFCKFVIAKYCRRKSTAVIIICVSPVFETLKFPICKYPLFVTVYDFIIIVLNTIFPPTLPSIDVNS